MGLRRLVEMAKKKVTIPGLQLKKENGEKIVMVTAYDYAVAKIAEASEADMILVGDSLGNVMLGYDTTVPVTIEDMIHHTRPVARAVKNTLVIADMPFGSYQCSKEQAIQNAVRLMKEGGAHGVKLEGGPEIAHTIQSLVKMGIPVMGHIGLTPQTVSKLGGYKIQGRNEEAAYALVEAAQTIEEAGAFSMILECVTKEVAAMVTEKVDIPTIGIGAGVNCDGQVLVLHDMLGYDNDFNQVFVKKYANVGATILQAFNDFAADVRSGAFPDDAHSFAMDAEELKKIY